MLLAALTVCTMLSAPVAAAAAAPVQPPSIVLISIDTLRADRLSCYGYRRIATPHIDAIAQGGTLFTAVESQVPLTFPSHVSLFTSTFPFFNGIEDNAEVLRPNAVTLAAVLKSHGYQTGAFVGGFALDRRFGLNRGFDLYDSTFDLSRQKETDAGDVKRLGAEVVADALQWLGANSQHPFFLFLHLYDLHTPYNLPAADRARLGSGYDAELRYVDEQVGVFWNALRERRLLENTLVVFTSDHGEGLGEHGEQTHGYFIYQSTLWVPLIIHWPKENRNSKLETGNSKFDFRASPPGDAAGRVDDPAALMDVAPSILQFAGMPAPAEFQGRSLLDAARGGKQAAAHDVYSESLYGHNHFGCAALASLRAGRYQYIQAPRPELYDLMADPGQTRNLVRQDGAMASALQERLASLRSRFRSEPPLGGKELDPEAVARLSSLGYVAISSQHSEAPEAGADPKDRIGDFESYGRAIVLASAGKIEESNAILSQLIREHPEIADLRMSLGLNDQKVRRPQAAAEEFRQVIKQEPLNAQAHYDLGLSLYELHAPEEATRELQAAFAIAPYYTHAEGLWGSICLQKGDYPAARGHFEHILTVDPNDYGANYNLGAMDILQARWDEGERHLRAALLLDPKSPDAHNTLGSLYLRKGDVDQAVPEFQEAIRLRSEDASIHFNLGLAYRGENRVTDAASEFRRALAIDPQFAPAREALARLTDSGK